VLPQEGRYTLVLGWSTVFTTGLLLGSGAFDAVLQGLPSRWSQSAAFAIFVLAHVGTLGTKRPPIARALASLLYLALILEAYWFSWGPTDGTRFALSNLGLEAVRDGLLLWALGLGALVLTLSPPRMHMRLLGAALGLFLMLPWIWGLSAGSSRLTIIDGPEWLDWGWYVQPAFLGLAILVPIALLALVETAYKIGDMGTLEHGVAIGLSFLTLAPLGLLVIHQVAPELVQPAAPHLVESSLHPDKPSAANHSPSGHAGTQPPPAGKKHGAVSDQHQHQHEAHQAEESPLHSEDLGAPSSDGLTQAPPNESPPCDSLLLPARPVQDIKEKFNADEWSLTATELLARRYPDAAWLMTALNDVERMEMSFPQPPISWRRLVTGLSSSIYETARLVRFQEVDGDGFSYPISTDTFRKVPLLPLFPRSEIVEILPSQVRGLRLSAIHFRGEAGTKQIEDLLDHLNAFTWSLNVEIALLDQTHGREIAARDAVLASLIYVQSYLEFARNHHPEAYQAILSSQPTRETTLFLWERAICALELSGTETRLGIEDVGLLPLVFGVDFGKEVSRLRNPDIVTKAVSDPAQADETTGSAPPTSTEPSHSEVSN
jgi:hypothetical protein